MTGWRRSSSRGRVQRPGGPARSRSQAPGLEALGPGQRSAVASDEKEHGACRDDPPSGRAAAGVGIQGGCPGRISWFMTEWEDGAAWQLVSEAGLGPYVVSAAGRIRVLEFVEVSRPLYRVVANALATQYVDDDARGLGPRAKDRRGEAPQLPPLPEQHDPEDCEPEQQEAEEPDHAPTFPCPPRALVTVGDDHQVKSRVELQVARPRDIVRRLGPIGILALMLAACSVTTRPSQESDAPSNSGYSMLDEAGLEQVRSSGGLNLDLTSGSLSKADVGLPSDAYGPSISAEDGQTLDITLAAPKGALEATTDRVRFNTTAARADFSQITYFLTADSPEDLFGLVREGVDQYGIDRDVAERWIAGVSARSDAASDFALDPGDKLGVDVVYDLRYDSTKPVQVIIVSVDLAVEPPGQVG